MTRLKFAVILNEENALDLHAAFTTHPQAEVLLDKSCVPHSAAASAAANPATAAKELPRWLLCCC